MKRFFKTVGMLLVCAALLTPNVDGRGRNNNGERKSPQTSHSQSSRPGNMGRPTHGSNRPGGNGNSNSSSHRPGHSGGTSSFRPGNNGGHVTTRPGNSGNNNYRPGNNGGNNHRPDQGFRPGNNGGNNHRPDQGFRPGNNGGNNHRPDQGYRPGNNGGNHHRPDQGYRPGNNHRPGHNNWNNGNHRPDHFGHRPHHIPHYAGWHRPAPPRHWHPAPHWRPFRSILGITLGTGFGISINALLNNGYNVNYYGDNTIYVSNAPMLNLNWPDAVLYYNGGGLCGSRFVYSTGYYDMNRYNMAYASLINTYGMPISVQNTSAGVEATWWGTGNQFIRLAYQSDYAQNGSLRYFTTLSFGN